MIIISNIFVVKNWRTKYSTHSAERFLLHCEYIRFFPKGLRPYLAHLSSSFIMYWKMIEETRRRKRHFTRRRWKQKKTGACWSMKNWFGFMIYNHVWLYYCIRLKQLRNFLIFTIYVAKFLCHRNKYHMNKYWNIFATSTSTW